MDSIKNFAVVVVSTTYNASATSIVLTTGHAARLPAAPFNLVWWNNTDYPGVWDDPNKEIVRVTAIASETLTVTRGQEGITATTKSAAGKEYRMMQASTAALFAQLAAVDGNLGTATATTPGPDDNSTKVATTAYVQGELTGYDTDVRTLTNKTLSGLTITGDTTVGTLKFEGTTADEFETTFTVVDPTADRTITAPDATGTMALVGGNIGAATATTPAANDNSTLVATTAALQTELTAYASDTVSFTNKTFNAGATGNVLQFVRGIELVEPQLVDGTGCTIGATSTAIEYKHAIFSGTADQAANYAEWRLLIPNDLDTNVALTARLKFKLNGADTGTHRYVVSMAAVANSASASTAPGTPINLDFAGDASGADGDVEGVGLTTLSGWTTPLGGAQGTSLWIIRLARDGDAAQDASTVASTLLSLVIEFRRSE
jgi:hypothetical protein